MPMTHTPPAAIKDRFVPREVLCTAARRYGQRMDTMPYPSMTAPKFIP